MKFLKENVLVIVVMIVVATAVYKQAVTKSKNDEGAAKQGNILVIPAIEIK
jgi:hypothetical protein